MDFIFKVDPIRRSIKVPDAFTVLTMDHNIHKLVFICPYYEDFAFDSASIVFMVDAPDGKQYSIPAEEYESFPNSPSPYVKFTLTLKSYITSVVGYMSFCITADIISSGNVIEKSWHSKNITISIGGHIDNDDSEDIPEEDVPTINQRLNNLDSKVGRLQTTVNGMVNGTPPTASSTSGMNPEVSPIYVNTTDGNWYYYDGSAWQIGGQYGGVVTDTTLSISGAPADAKAVGDALAEKADSDDVTSLDTRVTEAENTVSDLSSAVEAKADVADVESVQSNLDNYKNGIETLDGAWQVGNMDKTTVYPRVKYKVCNPTIQLFDRDVALHIESGYYLNLNYFDSEGARTASWTNRIGTHTVPSGQRFNVFVTENPVDDTLVITDITRFVDAITFSTVLEERLNAVETAVSTSETLVNSLNDGNTFITDGWQVGQLDKKTVYPNVKKYTLSNPVIRSFDSDVLIHVKSGFKYTLNYFDAEEQRTSIISNITLNRTIKARQRFNLFVTRNPIDESEVITDATKIEFESAVYFRGVIGQDIDALKQAVDPIADPPDYYFDNDYLPSKCTAIDTLAKTCAANGDIFIFITDEHWTLNEKQSPALLRYISKHCNLSLLFDGGDNDDYGSPAFSAALRNSFTRKIHYVAGNHDWFPPTDGNMLYYWNDMQNNDQIGNAVEHYYYVDNVQKNIRYIILNAWVNNSGTLVSGYSAEQLAWFTGTALNVPSGWDIIVFSHYVGNTVTSAPSGARDFRDAIDAYNADSSHTGQVIAIITGHTHADFVCHTAGGVPIIATTCDKNKGNGAGNESWLQQYRPNGTIYEQAFDVMFLDRSAKKITALRIGCPAMDNTDIASGDTGFDYSPTLEQRVINYA